MSAQFSKVLIANRGEIALRIVRACRDLGLQSVAVYTSAESNADFVRFADDAWLLPGTGAATTYLDMRALIDIAHRAGAQAIHPGYGYLAESPEFARAVTQAGLTWIGPAPEALEALGDKAGARAVANAVGAPTTPGSGRAVKDIEEALSIADTIGYPVAVKAVHGGGGRGFRTAANREDLPTALESASREAVAAFGRGECLLEKQIVRPRHIETQCLADSHGNVVVVSTRDCSLQRRHQKVVEEAPAPFLTDEQNQILADASQKILSHVGYVGAATCEFLLGQDGTITFMEANARIQVEHTITEEVTGVDLVAWQLKIACGEELPSSMPAPRGHAFQFRINAENPANRFIPATGRIVELHEPAGPGIRMDSGVKEGTTVGTDFDPMLAKLIVTGEDREQALARARRALDEYILNGVATLLPLHRELVRTPAFTTDFSVYTLWLEQEFMPSFSAPQELTAETSPEDTTTDVVVEVDGHRLTVKVPASLTTGGKQTQVKPPRRRKTSRVSADSGDLTAPMQGTIVTVDVQPGDTVNEGDRLAVIEAMKMEQPLTATRTATVSEVCVEAGSAVKSGTPLVKFQ